MQDDTQTKEAEVNVLLKSGNLTKYEAKQKIFALRQEEARQLDELINGASSSGFMSGIGDCFAGLMSFDVGTDRVPRDMLAIIHQVDMVAPAYDTERIRSGQTDRSMHGYNNFTVAGNMTREPQSQIAVQAGLGVRRATRRNS